MAQLPISIFIIYLLFSSSFAKAEEDEGDSCGIMNALPYIVVGAGAATFGGPLLLGTLGFTAKGIAAQSIASGLMKMSALFSGGGVIKGGLVATLQSLGATGSMSAWAATGAKTGYNIYQQFFCGRNQKSKK